MLVCTKMYTDCALAVFSSMYAGKLRDVQLLQIRVQEFDSPTRLHIKSNT